MRLRDLPNLGPKSEQWLHSIGVSDVATLAAIGPVEAYRLLQEKGVPGLTLNMLWAMEGALEGVDWRHLPPGRKEELRAELER
jgi:DNA transformation protein